MTKPETKQPELCDHCADVPWVMKLEDNDDTVGYRSFLRLCLDCYRKLTNKVAF